jgi:hypothetical protein
MQYYASIIATQGNDTLTKVIYWNVLPVGINDTLTLDNPGNQTSREGDFVYVSLSSSSALGLSRAYTFTGLPPSIVINEGEGTALSGYMGPRPAAPYNITVTVSNGFETRQVSFQWIVEPIALPGDFDGSGLVDQGDYQIWRDNFGRVVEPVNFGDANGDGRVDAADYTVWRDHLGQVFDGGGDDGSGATSLLANLARDTEPASRAASFRGRTNSSAAILADLAIDRPHGDRWLAPLRARHVAAPLRDIDDNLILTARSIQHLRQSRQFEERTAVESGNDVATAEAFADFDAKELLVAL